MGLQHVQTIRSNYIESLDRPDPSFIEGLDFGNYDQPKLNIDYDDLWPMVFLDVTIGKKM